MESMTRLFDVDFSEEKKKKKKRKRYRDCPPFLLFFRPLSFLFSQFFFFFGLGLFLSATFLGFGVGRQQDELGQREDPLFVRAESQGAA